MPTPKHPTSAFFRDVFLRMEKEGTFHTRREFSEKIKTYPHIVNEILAGKRSPTVQMIAKLAENFQVSPTYIIMGKGSMFLNRELFAQKEVKYNEDHNDLVNRLTLAEQEVKYQKRIIDILEAKKK